MRHNSEIILRALLENHTIEHQGIKYRWFNKGDQIQENEDKVSIAVRSGIFMEAKVYTKDLSTPSSVRWMIFDVSIGNFVDWCNEFDHDQIAIIGANVVLTHINQR